MKKLALFIGDSLTSAENAQGKSFCNYPQYFPEYSCVKLGVSGTTIGEYSIYPVDGYSLLSQIPKNKDMIEPADVIFLEYGVNDISALYAQNVTYAQIRNSLVKAVDAIRQINSTAELYFVVFSNSKAVLDAYEPGILKYLQEYYKGFELVRPFLFTWAECYLDFVSQVSRVLPVIPMVTEVSFLSKYLDTDGIHPNTAGYKQIAADFQKNFSAALSK